MAKSKTLIYLEDEQLSALRHRAHKSGRSMAAEVREAVARYLETPTTSLEGFVGCAEGPAGDDASARADEILKGILG
ncbi:MAG TPA: CopG family transcriptional regulator [Polyangia bacterium]|nr:CopG family transcriptional regulator [Polyangia bacterium]